MCDALFLAAEAGDSEALKAALEKSDANSLNQFGVTPLCVAVKFHQHKIVSCLLEHGADPYLKNCALDSTIMSFCALYGSQSCLKLLYSHMEAAFGVDEARRMLNVPNSNGDTPLMIACLTACKPIVGFILSKGACVSATSKVGLNAFACCVLRQDEEHARLHVFSELFSLLTPDEKRTTMESRFLDSAETLLHLAARNDLYLICEFLEKEGMPLGTPNREGLKALDVAGPQTKLIFNEKLAAETKKKPKRKKKKKKKLATLLDEESSAAPAEAQEDYDLATARLYSLHPHAQALSISVSDVLLCNTADLSLSQLETVETILHSLLKAATEARVNAVRELERKRPSLLL